MTPDPSDIPEEYREKSFDIHKYYDEAQQVKNEAQKGLTARDPRWKNAMVKLQEDMAMIKERQRNFMVVQRHVKPREHAAMSGFMAHPAQQVLVESVVRLYLKAGLLS